ncbi:MAG: response regulator transcription factor [Magnetococcus sp. WYHC-3]
MDSSSLPRLMIVEDTPATRRLLSVSLARLGFPVVAQVENGQLAVERYAEGGVDLVLMDVEMPVMGGLDALKEIKAKHEDAFVVMYTNVDDPDMAQQCLLAGATSYLSKSLSVADLGAALQRMWQERPLPLLEDEDPPGDDLLFCAPLK